MRRLLVLALLAAPLAAHADEDDVPKEVRDRAATLNPEARPHFLAGFKAFGAKDYKTASAEFEQAYKRDPQTSLLFTWAQSERLSGNCPHALELYQKYLYSEINEKQAEVTRGWIKECGGVVGTAKPPPPPPPKVENDTRYIWYRDVPADGLAASGALGVTIGIVYLFKSRGAVDDANKAPDLPTFKNARDAVSHDNKVGGAALAVGGVLGIAAVGLYIYDSKHHRSTAITTDGQTLSLATTF